MGKEGKKCGVNIRLTESEQKSLDKATADKGYFLGSPRNKKPNRARYIRALLAAENNPAFSQVDLKYLRGEFADLCRLGGNLNQLAHHLNVQQLLNKMSGSERAPVVKTAELNAAQKSLNELYPQVIKLQKHLADVISRLAVD